MTKRTKARRPAHVVCINSGGYVDLDPLKIYRLRPDAQAQADGLLRVIDNSGEDYLCPANYFRPIQAPPGLFRLVRASAR